MWLRLASWPSTARSPSSFPISPLLTLASSGLDSLPVTHPLGQSGSRPKVASEGGVHVRPLLPALPGGQTGPPPRERPKGSGAASSSAADSPAVAHEPAQQQQQRGSKRELPKQHQQQQQQQPKKKDNKGKGKGKNDKKRRPTVAQDGSMTHTRAGKPLCADLRMPGWRDGSWAE